MNDRYKEARTDVRFFSGLMFGQLTVFLVTSGGLIKVFFDNPGFARIPIALTGLVVTVVFFVVNLRARDWVEASRKRANESLSPEESPQESSPAIPKWRGKLTATNATYFLYGYAAAAWIILLIVSAVKLLKAGSC